MQVRSSRGKIRRYTWLIALITASVPNVSLSAEPVAADIDPSAFRWLRTLKVISPAHNPVACAVLDAEIFAHATPALRDLRLFRGAAEVPYAVEESYDEQSLLSGVTRTTDRSFYETSVAGILLPPTGEAASGSEVSNDSTLTTQMLLLPHVPVERIVFTPAPHAAQNHARYAVIVSALPEGASTPENVRLTLSEGETSIPVTLGANLQHAARVTVTVSIQRDVPDHAQGNLSHSAPLSQFQSVSLQMRRRSLCFPTQDGEEPTLYLGNENISASKYHLSLPPVTDSEREGATMGPLVANPVYHPSPEQGFFNRDAPARWWTYLFTLFSLISLLSVRMFFRYRNSKR